MPLVVPPAHPGSQGVWESTSRAIPAAGIPSTGTVPPGFLVPCGCQGPAAGIEWITDRTGHCLGSIYHETEQGQKPGPAKSRQSLSPAPCQPWLFSCAANTKAMCKKLWDTTLAELRGQINTQGTKTPSAPAELNLLEDLPSCQTQLCPRADQLNQPV